MADSSGTTGAPGIGSDINAIERKVDSVKPRFLVPCSAPMFFFYYEKAFFGGFQENIMLVLFKFYSTQNETHFFVCR